MQSEHLVAERPLLDEPAASFLVFLTRLSPKLKKKLLIVQGLEAGEGADVDSDQLNAFPSKFENRSIINK